MRAVLARARASRAHALALWSFYSPDFDAAARDLARGQGGDAIGGGRCTSPAASTRRPSRSRRSVRASISSPSARASARSSRSSRAAAEGRDVRALRGTAHLDARGRLVSHGPGERQSSTLSRRSTRATANGTRIEITRGCVYACSFCQTPYMFKARFRHRSVAERPRARRCDAPQRLALRALPHADVALVRIERHDAEPRRGRRAPRERAGGRRPRGEDLFGTFPSEIRPEHVTERALEILERWVDNRTLVIGGQSGSERVLRETRRGHGVEDIVRAVAPRGRARLSAGRRFPPRPAGRDDRRSQSLDAPRRGASSAWARRSTPTRSCRSRARRCATPSRRRSSPRRCRRWRVSSRSGEAYGQWRRQLVTARELVRARRANHLESWLWTASTAPSCPTPWGSRTAIAELTGRATPSAGPGGRALDGRPSRSRPSRRSRRRPRVARRRHRGAPRARARRSTSPPRSGRGCPFSSRCSPPPSPCRSRLTRRPSRRRAGSRKRTRAAIPRDAPTRSYKDASHKPELLCALDAVRRALGLPSRRRHRCALFDMLARP